jgi:hypothetical protein
MQRRCTFSFSTLNYSLHIKLLQYLSTSRDLLVTMLTESQLIAFCYLHYRHTRCNRQACRRKQIHTQFWRENTKERDYLDDVGIDKYTVGCATTNDATKNECYNEQLLLVTSGCYREHRCYNERMLQRIVIINNIMMLQRTQMLQRTTLQRTNVTTNSYYQ